MVEHNKDYEEKVLQALLSQEGKPRDKVHIKRLGVDFEIEALSGDVIQKIQEQATFYKGKGRKREKILDEEKFGALCIAKACIVPKWNDSKLLEKYNTKDVTEVVRKSLLGGEIVRVSEAILELSGFIDEDEEENEVKN